jgi:hypothetical protein
MRMRCSNTIPISGWSQQTSHHGTASSEMIAANTRYSPQLFLTLRERRSLLQR